ncbi:MAG: RHS repeat-associated core domain-containing protein, partial [Akkermansia sp.]
MKRRRKPDNTNNRPISFTSEDGQSIVTCGYDYMGRRYMKKVTANGTVTLHHHYLYRGYLQIAALDLTATDAPALWHNLWDPTEPIATRPFSIRKNGTWYTYAHDLTKNVTELYKTDGTLEAAYDYTPFGIVTKQGIDDQPFQWSSEVYDAELGMVYYNYRHYNPTGGRWINRDPIAEQGGLNLY